MYIDPEDFTIFFTIIIIKISGRGLDDSGLPPCSYANEGIHKYEAENKTWMTYMKQDLFALHCGESMTFSLTNIRRMVWLNGHLVKNVLLQ